MNGDTYRRKLISGSAYSMFDPDMKAKIESFLRSFSGDVDALIFDLLTDMRAVTSSDAATVYVADGDVLRFVYVQNDTMTRADCGNHYIGAGVPIDDKSMCGYVAVTKKPLIIRDVHAIGPDMPFHFNGEYDKKSGYVTVSVLTVPILENDGDLSGVLQLINPKKDGSAAESFEDWMVGYAQFITENFIPLIARSFERYRNEPDRRGTVEERPGTTSPVKPDESEKTPDGGGGRMDNKRLMVMIADDTIANLKEAKKALSGLYDVFTVPSASKMFDMLERNKPKLILLDIDMPVMDGFEAIKILKSKPETADIPVIFLTAKSDAESEFEGLSLGAIDYISKPFMPQLLRKRVELHITVEFQKRILEEQAQRLETQSKTLRHFNENLQIMIDEKTSKVLELQNAILKTVADLVESRDDITGGHVERTQYGLKILIGGLDDLGLYKEQMQEWDIGLMLQSSQLHDVGKIAISDNILNKPGRLTPEEFDEMKKHTTLGVRIIERIEAETSDSEFLKYAKIFAGTHQEKWDGSGYPNGLAGEDIPLPGRLMAIADVYDALTSDRPYKKAFPHEDAVRIILEGRGSHFDPILADVFEQVAGQFSPSRRT
ncbi:MAG: response regulator [Synergistaceae bacterium]|jgi:putative two-component system response regulator|nr:response regulator [Synergistaceae bacterium]